MGGPVVVVVVDMTGADAEDAGSATTGTAAVESLRAAFVVPVPLGARGLRGLGACTGGDRTGVALKSSSAGCC